MIKIDMVLTDPPYNVDYHGTAGAIANDNMEADHFIDFLSSAFKNMKTYLKAGGVILYLVRRRKERKRILYSLKECWTPMSRGSYMGQKCFNTWQSRLSI